MANFNDIKHEIDQNVNTNGVQAITGAILNETLKDMIDEVDEKKQDTLVAGQNITIQGNVISATGGGGQEYYAGDGLELNGNVFSVKPSDFAGNGLGEDANGKLQVIPYDIAGHGLTTEGDALLAVDPSGLAGHGLEVDGDGRIAINPGVVQERLEAGSNITIYGNTISATDTNTTYSAGQGLELNGTTFAVKAGSGLGFDANGNLVNTGGGGGGQTLVAGDGIDIDQNDAINAKLGNGLQLDGNNNIEINPSVVATQSDLAGKQNTLQAGSNIQINGNVISATDTNTTYSAGSGLNLNGTTFSVDTTAIQEKLTAGQNITISGNVISAAGGSGGNYLPLDGGVLKNTASGQTSTILNIVPPLGGPGGVIYQSSNDNGGYGNITIGSAGYNQTVLQNDFIQVANATSGKSLDITSEGFSDGSIYHASLPTLTQDEILATQSDVNTAVSSKQDILTAGSGITIQNNVISATGGSGSSYSAGNGIDITNNTISVDASDLDGAGLTTNQNGELVVDTSVIQGKLSAGQGIDASDLANDTISVNPSNLAGYGLYVDGNNQLSVQNDVFQEILTAGDGIEIDANNEISVKAGSGLGFDANGYLINTGGGGSYTAAHGIDIINDAISVDVSDLNGTGLIADHQRGILEVDFTSVQEKLTAGSGITISGNTISATGGGSGLWTSGTGTDSVMSPGAFQANGNNSVSAGDYTRSNGTSSIALGTSTTTTGLSAVAIGANSTAAGSYSVALGHGLGAVNSDETALGKFNNYIDTGTTAEKTFFTIGNGTSNNTKSNIIEIKQNNDAFLVGIGGFDGTNASQALSLQTVINSKQNQLVSGVDIKTINGQSIVGGGDLVISGGSTLSAGDGIGIQNDTISVKYDSTRGIGYDNSVGHNELYVQLGSGLQFDGNGAIELSGGSGSSYTAGTGISIDSSNVITNTAPDPGLWIAGSGAGSIKSVNANTGSVGANSMSIGRKSRATGMNSIALGDFITTNGIASSGLGTNSVADGMNSTVIGNGASTLNTDEIGLGKFNNSINTGTTAEKTQFTVGNGTGTTARSNLIEAKQNNDIYVLGIGGFDGTNASQALTLQTVINSKQNQLVSGVDIKTINGQSIVGGGNLVISGGSSLWTSGTGQNSLVSPGAGASSQGSDADGVGAIVIGEDSNANGDYSFAHGQASMANGDYSAAFVSGNSTGDYSFAAGNGADAQAESSVAIGSGATTIFDNSDPDNPINADSSVAIGNGAQTYGLNSIAIGDSATAQGERSIALSGGEASGLGSIAGGNASHANGMYSTAFAGSTADANYSFAASDGQAYAHYSTALSGGEARGEGAFASGQGNGAYGYSAAALGYMAQTYSQANGALSTDPNAGEVALGRYNYSEQGIVFTVGCGYYDETDPDNPVDVRQNAVAIDSTGKIFLKGLGGYTGTSTSGCTDLVSFLSNQ